MKEFLCETQELAIGYGKTPLASGIALRANPGQILVLVGPNGAGKSTLLKTLAGQLAPLGGTVLLDGQDLTADTGTARAQQLAQELKNGLEIRPSMKVGAGFRLAAKDGSGYFDCSGQELAEMLMPFFRDMRL